MRSIFLPRIALSHEALPGRKLDKMSANAFRTSSTATATPTSNSNNNANANANTWVSKKDAKLEEERLEVERRYEAQRRADAELALQRQRQRGQDEERRKVEFQQQTILSPFHPSSKCIEVSDQLPLHTCLRKRRLKRKNTAH